MKKKTLRSFFFNLVYQYIYTHIQNKFRVLYKKSIDMMPSHLNSLFFNCQ